MDQYNKTYGEHLVRTSSDNNIPEVEFVKEQVANMVNYLISRMPQEATPSPELSFKAHTLTQAVLAAETFAEKATKYLTVDTYFDNLKKQLPVAKKYEIVDMPNSSQDETTAVPSPAQDASQGLLTDSK